MKTKNFYWDQAENQVDDIISTLGDGLISIDTAVKKILSVPGLELTGLNKDNVWEYVLEVSANV
tara:strand:- start:187 stop:378 length:192 start_codon:yes stop_codon:yes gene_type:complete